MTLPYTIAVLCYLFDADGRVLLLRRDRPPNHSRHSPIGGKLEQHLGESPVDCALREIQEEAGLTLTHDQLHLTGMVSETAHEGENHWLMFLYEVTQPVDIEPGPIDEGVLEWHDPADLESLNLPQTDREAIWPLFWKHRGGFFVAHLDCTQAPMTCRVDQAYAAGDKHPDVG